MGVLVKPQADQAGGILRTVDITQETAGWHYSSFSVHGHLPARVVRPQDMSIEVRGAGNTQRRIQHILDTDQEAERLVIVEAITPTGNWSSFPRTSTTPRTHHMSLILRRPISTAFSRPMGSPFSACTTMRDSQKRLLSMTETWSLEACTRHCLL